MSIIKMSNSKASLLTAFKYVTRPGKVATTGVGKGYLIEGINCRPESYYDEVMTTKRFYGKTTGRQYYHLIISSPPGEGNPEEQLRLSKEFVEKNQDLKGYEVLIVVHNDKKHIHSHILINSVCTIGGKKLDLKKSQYREWIKLNREICIGHGIQLVEKEPNKGDLRTDNRKTYETVRRLGRDADLVVVYQAVCKAKEVSCSWEDFSRILEKSNIKIERKQNRKHVVFTYNGRKIRDSNLSKTFSDLIDKENLEHEFCNNRNRKDHDHRRKEIDREIKQRKRSVGNIIKSDVLPNTHRKKRDRSRERVRTDS